MWFFICLSIIELIAVFCLILIITKEKKKSEKQKSKYEDKIHKYDEELFELKEAFKSGGRSFETPILEYRNKYISELSEEIMKLNQKYIKFLRAYMLARKKTEVEIIEEIEASISDDYEKLGSESVPATSYIASAMADFYTSQIKTLEIGLYWRGEKERSSRITDVRKNAESLIKRAKNNQYVYEAALESILEEHPEISTDYIKRHYGISLSDAVQTTESDATVIADYQQQISKFQNQISKGQDKIDNYRQQINEMNKENQILKGQVDILEEESRRYEDYKDIRWTLLRDSISEYQEEFASNLTAIPYMSRIIADIMTVDIERLAWSLSWGENKERKKKVASLLSLKKEKSDEIERIKGAEYQLAYLLELYPALQDVIDTDFNELDISYEQISDTDPVEHYLTREEWVNLSIAERNQLALDRYIESRRKTKWQIGRDYELYCGYCYEKKGIAVDYYGSYHGLEDLGRDLIISQDNKTSIVQCKYWSKEKQIHEKHVMQLYGTVIEYNIENNQNASGILITNTVLSDRAKEFARILGITYKENFKLGDFPRIKCNIGVGEYGERTKIYHLPFDQQYDVTKIEEEKGESLEFTVAEAERKGFRRAYKWHGTE